MSTSRIRQHSVLPVCVCSGTSTWNVETSCTVFGAAARLERQVYAVRAEGAGGGNMRGRGGVALARTSLLKGLRGWADMPQITSLRCLWLDDDIEVKVDQSDKLAEAIEYADEKGYNFVVPYKLVGKWDVIRWKGWEPYTEEELNKMNDWDIIDGFAGLGFYYGYTPLDYHFSMGGVNDEGEDFRFFRDNKIELRILHLKIGHFKPQWLR